MIKNSLAHNYVQKQTSWSDDPFGFEAEDKKNGIWPQMEFNHKSNLDDYIQDLIATHAVYQADEYVLSLDMITSDEQDELLRLYIETIDREIDGAYCNDDVSINSDFNCALLSMLKCNTRDKREDLANVIHKNLFTYYNDTLNNLLSTGCEIFFNNAVNESSYYYRGEQAE